MPHVLITGATGFIGGQLVRQLSEQGCEITCLVRETANCRALEPYQPHLVVGDINDSRAVRQALHSVDRVYHVAGRTKALSASDLFAANATGTRCLAAACAERTSPPVLVYISTLAAAGPSARGRPKTESEQPAPVSAYGRSKRGGELALMDFAERVPTTVLRPPIVLGAGDRTGLAMFQSIAQFGLHFVPGFGESEMSIIHVDDLVTAIQTAAASGRRLTAESETDGIYFVAADETPSYAMLGKWIGMAVGRTRTLVVRVPGFVLRGTAGINEVVGRGLGHALYLNWDKSREALAGSWHCTNERLKRDTNFSLTVPLQQRLVQTAQWYLEQGWLKPPRTERPLSQFKRLLGRVGG